MNVSERLARFLVDTGDVPDEALVQAKRALLDTVGVALAGSVEEGPRILAEWVREQRGGGEATVLGRDFRAPAADAALLNGTAAHALDYDDVNLPMRGHPSVPLIPALVGLAEREGGSGHDLLMAYVLGFEIEAKLGRIVGGAHYGLGWHATSTLGSLGAAGACASLLRLAVPKTVTALGIAASLAGGLQRNFGTMTKPLHAGWAARNGVVAAELAARGLTADQQALDGDGGFLRAMSGGADVDLTPLDGLGEPYEIVSSGIGVKLYPCCYAVHRSLDAALELRARHHIDPATIVKVDVEVNRGALLPLRVEPPTSGLEGKFSMGYCLAAALLDGRVALSSFTDEAVGREEARKLMSLVEAHEGAPAGETPIGGYAHVQIGLVDGTDHSLKVDTPRGDPSNPLSWDDLTAKFRECAGRVLPEGAGQRSIDLIGDLEALAEVRTLTEALTDAPARARR